MEAPQILYQSIGKDGSQVWELFLSTWSSLLGPRVLAVWSTRASSQMISNERRLGIARLVLAGEWDPSGHVATPSFKLLAAHGSDPRCLLLSSLFNVAGHGRPGRAMTPQSTPFDCSGDQRLCFTVVLDPTALQFPALLPTLEAQITTVSHIFQSACATPCPSVTEAERWNNIVASFTEVAISLIHALHMTLQLPKQPLIQPLICSAQSVAENNQGSDSLSFFDDSDSEGSNSHMHDRSATVPRLRVHPDLWAQLGVQGTDKLLARIIHAHIAAEFHTVVVGSDPARVESVLHTLAYLTPPTNLFLSSRPLGFEYELQVPVIRQCAALRASRMGWFQLDSSEGPVYIPPLPSSQMSLPFCLQLTVPAAHAVVPFAFPHISLQGRITSEPIDPLYLLVSLPHSVSLVDLNHDEVYLRRHTHATSDLRQSALRILGAQLVVPVPQAPKPESPMHFVMQPPGYTTEGFIQVVQRQEATLERIQSATVASMVTRFLRQAHRLPKPSVIRLSAQLFLRQILQQSVAFATLTELGRVEGGKLTQQSLLRSLHSSEITRLRFYLNLPDDDLDLVKAVSGAFLFPAVTSRDESALGDTLSRMGL